VVRENKERVTEPTYGVDRKFKSAFPTGTSLLPTEVAKEILRDPDSVGRRLADYLGKKEE